MLRRYKQIAQIPEPLPKLYTAPKTLQGRQVGSDRKVLFFNLGFMEIEREDDFSAWLPLGSTIKPDSLIVVDDNDVAMLHDVALYLAASVIWLN